MNTMRIWAIRLVALGLLAFANQQLQARTTTCYNCNSDGRGGSTCDPGSNPGYTNCQASETGGCNPNGGSPCNW